MNLGLRWDYFGVAHEKDGLFYRFDTTAGEEVPAGQLYDKDLQQFRASRFVRLRPDRQGHHGRSRLDGASSTTPLPRTFFWDISRGTASFVRDRLIRGLVRLRFPTRNSTGGALDPNTPCILGTISFRRIFRCGPASTHTLRTEFQLNVQQAIGRQSSLAGRLRWNEGNQTVSVPRHQSAEPSADHRGGLACVPTY